MPAVAINIKYVPLPDLTFNNYLKAGYRGEFRIESTEPKLPIEVGSELLFLMPQEKELFFTNAGVINKIGKREFIKGRSAAASRTISYKDKDKYCHFYDFEVKKSLNNNNRLSELEYSLPTIENYHSPEVHFESQYRRLPESDYQTIVNGWVYATRTVFGKLVNSLPRQNKLEFMIQAMDHFSTIDFRSTSLVEGLSFLHEYIERRILSRGRLLVAIDGVIKKELHDLVPSDRVGFIDPETNVIQNINVQAKIFKSLFEIDKEKSLQSSLQDVLRTNGDLEDRFKKLFKGRPWPVDLEK